MTVSGKASMRRIVQFFLFVSLFSWLTISPVFAKSGCCSGHSGVNCSAGPQGNGKVICNDGWTGSSCRYAEMVMCGGNSTATSQSAPSQPTVIVTPRPTLLPRPTTAAKTSVMPTSMTPSPKPVARVVAKQSCSALADNLCPQTCDLGNDIDCCQANSAYYWRANQGCYPKVEKCAAQHDQRCDWYCTPGNDADCCEANTEWHWFENQGCYPQKSAQCSGQRDGFCPKNCENGTDADCCEQNIAGYQWYENWGCYPQQSTLTAK